VATTATGAPNVPFQKYTVNGSPGQNRAPVTVYLFPWDPESTERTM
jgi:hypothetical protein